MSMTTLKSKVVYTVNLTGCMSLGPIPPQVLYEKLTDGRIAGLLMEEMHNHLFRNVAMAPSRKSSFDLYVDDLRYEARTITKAGVKLIPSSQIGTGRTYDEDAYINKRDSIDGYVFADVRNSPVLRILRLREVDVPLQRSLSGRECDALFDASYKRESIVL